MGEFVTAAGEGAAAQEEIAAPSSSRTLAGSRVNSSSASVSWCHSLRLYRSPSTAYRSASSGAARLACSMCSMAGGRSRKARGSVKLEKPEVGRSGAAGRCVRGRSRAGRQCCRLRRVVTACGRLFGRGGPARGGGTGCSRSSNSAGVATARGPRGLHQGEVSDPTYCGGRVVQCVAGVATLATWRREFQQIATRRHAPPLSCVFCIFRTPKRSESTRESTPSSSSRLELSSSSRAPRNSC